MPLIYKYLSPVRKSFFSDGLLRMTQPGDLNDPFECLSFYPEFDWRPMALTQLRQSLQEKGLMPTRQQIEETLEMVDSPAYRTNMLKSCYTSFLAHLDKQFGIVSFSETWSSSTMWAHYALVHRGFCIGIDQPALPLPDDDEQIACGSFYQVQYIDARKVSHSTGSVNLHARYLFMKHKRDWEYEREVRVFYRLIAADRTSLQRSERGYEVFLKHFSFENVKELILGYYVDRVVEDNAVAFAKANKVVLYKMTLEHSEDFEMGRVRIE